MSKPDSVDWVAAAGVLALGLCMLASASIAAEPAHYPIRADVSAKNRKVVIEAMRIIERECPALQKVGWLVLKRSAERNPYKVMAPSISVTRAGKGWSSEVPFRKPLGWPFEVGVWVDFGPKGPAAISLKVGSGKTPGIASRAAGGYRGAEICALDEAVGGYRFRRVPDLRVLDQLR